METTASFGLGITKKNKIPFYDYYELVVVQPMASTSVWTRRLHHTVMSATAKSVRVMNILLLDGSLCGAFVCALLSLHRTIFCGSESIDPTTACLSVSLPSLILLGPLGGVVSGSGSGSGPLKSHSVTPFGVVSLLAIIQTTRAARPLSPPGVGPSPCIILTRNLQYRYQWPFLDPRQHWQCRVSKLKVSPLPV